MEYGLRAESVRGALAPDLNEKSRLNFRIELREAPEKRHSSQDRPQTWGRRREINIFVKM